MSLQHPVAEHVEPSPRQAPGEINRRWLQVHLSTAVVMMVCAGVLLKLNLLPVWHFSGQEAGSDLFEITGYGWPFKYSDTGLFYGPFRPPSFSLVKVCCNALVALLLVLYAAIVAEWRKLPYCVARGVFIGSVFGLILGIMCFSCLALSAMGPVLSDVSFSIVFKPWWQNWRSAFTVFMIVSPIVGTIVGIRTFVLQTERST
jgi:hypothetical protein